MAVSLFIWNDSMLIFANNLKFMNMYNVISSTIKKISNWFGFNITKYNKSFENVKNNWLKNYNIDGIIDVGANIGCFIAFIHKIFPEAKIYAFEPLRDCYKQLILKEKYIKTLKTFNLALGDKKGIGNIWRSSFAPSSSILEMNEAHKNAFPYTFIAARENIEIDTLDNIIGNEKMLTNLLLKIDVQGYEKQVIMGAPKTLVNTKIIIVELSFEELYKGTAKFDEIYSLLKKFGFSYSGSWDQLFNPADGKPLQQDAIFIKEKL